jgi:hypothetical protein
MWLRFAIALLVATGLLFGQKIPPASFSGTVHGVSSKQITIEKEDGNLLDFDIDRKTRIVRGDKKISATDLESGEVVTIEAREVMGKFLIAMTITAQPKSKD